MSEFLNMGGYAAYVWPSMGLALIVLLLNILVPLSKHRSALKKASDYHADNTNSHGGES